MQVVRQSGLVIAPESRHKGTNIPSVKSPVVNAERMRPGKRSRSVLCVPLSALTLMVGWQEEHQARKNPVPLLLLLLQHPFNSLSPRTTWVSRHQKGKPFWILLEQEMMRWQWHQLDHMQIICTSLQTDNHASTPPLTNCRRSLLEETKEDRRVNYQTQVHPEKWPLHRSSSNNNSCKMVSLQRFSEPLQYFKHQLQYST